VDVTVHVDIHNLVHNVHNIQKYIRFSLVSSLFFFFQGPTEEHLLVKWAPC